MKVFLVMLSVAVMLGVSSGSKLRGGALARRLAEKMAKRQGPGGPGAGGAGGEQGGDEGARRLSAMLGFGSLLGKCEMAKRDVEMYIEEDSSVSSEDFEEVEAAMFNDTILWHACPYVDVLGKCLIDADDNSRDQMVEKMAPHGLLFQCCNLVADVEIMLEEYHFTAAGEGPVESRLLTHGEHLGQACEEVFGTAKEEADELIVDIEAVEDGATCAPENRSNNLRALLRSLKQVLNSRNLNRRR